MPIWKYGLINKKRVNIAKELHLFCFKDGRRILISHQILLIKNIFKP